MTEVLTVILAAGEGTRMKSSRNKVLHKLGGKPLIGHVVGLAAGISEKVVCVVGHQAREVKKTASRYGELEFVRQDRQLGTGHAVQQAERYIAEHQGPILILYGDIPLINTSTLTGLVTEHQNRQAGMTILTAEMDDPAGYGRIVRDSSGGIKAVVEEHDTDPETAAIREVNSGIYCFNSQLLREALKQLDNDNQQGEYYLPDTMHYISKRAPLIPLKAEDPREILGINDRADLAEAEGILQKRIRQKHLASGVTLLDPDCTYIEPGVEIEQDVIIYPGSYFKGSTRIGSGSIIGPGCQLDNAKIASEVRVRQGSIIIGSQVDSGSTVGPYAYLRPGTEIAESCRIGNFVELKKSRVGRGSKVPHLSYVGDATIGSSCNVGAGTIFANYDGENKHQTVLEDEVFVGSNTTLVAPVKLGRGSSTGAGSVVTKDVEDNSLVLGVPARFYKKK